MKCKHEGHEEHEELFSKEYFVTFVIFVFAFKAGQYGI